MPEDNEKRDQTSVGIWIIVMILIILAAGAYLYYAGSDSMGVNEGGVQDDDVGTTTEWRTYQNDSFDFSMSYHPDWQLSTTSAADTTPLFNVYVPAENVSTTNGITHHTNITNVSVFPEGIPTEGLFAQSEDVNFDPGFAITDASRMFVLEDGTPFAAYLIPASSPASWAESGFVWVRVHMDDAQTQCFDENGNELSEEACDPLTEEHTVSWSGSVDSSAWSRVVETVERIELGQ